MVTMRYWWRGKISGDVSYTPPRNIQKPKDREEEDEGFIKEKEMEL